MNSKTCTNVQIPNYNLLMLIP